jgi:hypothetical protein
MMPSLDAARQLERDGFYKEAGKIYRQLGRHSDAARCWKYSKTGAPPVTVDKERLRKKLGEAK